MHIYQPFDFILGLVAIPIGLVGVARDIFRIRRGVFRNCDVDVRSLCLSTYILVIGPGKIAESIVPRHDKTPLINDLQWFEIVGLTAVLAAFTIAWLIRRRAAKRSIIAGT